MTREQQLDKLRSLGSCPSWWRFSVRRRWLQAYAAIMAYDTSQFAEILRSVYSMAEIGARSKAAVAAHPTLGMLTKVDDQSRLQNWVRPVWLWCGGCQRRGCSVVSCTNHEGAPR